ncbi:hypothetical protein [Spirosoma koreense]
MTLTWTFYPKGQPAVTLTVVYLPALDQQNRASGGFLIVPRNTAYVDWRTYQRFDTSDVQGRKDAFGQLERVWDTNKIDSLLIS